MALDPPGFSSQTFDTPLVASATGADEARDASLLSARAMDIARSQMGAVFQTAFVLYMFVGNQLNLFSIMFLLTMGTTPIKNIMATEQVFAPLTGPKVSLLLPKLMYVGLNLVGVGVFIWKVRAMGLLPVTSSDWISLFPVRHPAEFSAATVNV